MQEPAIYIRLDSGWEDGVVMQAGWGRSNKRKTGLATLARSSRWNYHLPTLCMAGQRYHPAGGGSVCAGMRWSSPAVGRRQLVSPQQ